MRLPDLEAWAIFAAVADRGSFSAAAQALSLSKATVSKAITRLERHVGAPLFARTSRRVALTETGVRLADHAHRLVAEADAAEEAARSEAVAPSGLIRLAAPLSFGVAKVAPAIAEFLLAHRGLSVDLALSDERVDIIAGGYDLALRIGALSDSSLRVRRVREVAMHVVAAPEYLEERGTPTHPRELLGHCCICYSLQATPDVWRFTGASGEKVTVRTNGALRVNNGDAMLPALCAGLGIAFLPDFIVDDDLAKGKLVTLLDDWHLPASALYLLSPPHRLRSKRVELLAEWLVGKLA